MKEKYDLSLDNRQIVSLLISALVVLGAVFVLGVVVGKKLSANQNAAQAPDLLTALDQKATQMEQVHKEPLLTFQDALTAKTPELAAAATKPAPEPVPQAKPPATAKVAEAPKAKKPLQARPAKSEPKRPEIAPAKAEGGTLRAAFARFDEGQGAFSLQVAASQSRDEAERQVGKLKARGYSPFIVEADLGEKGTWYRVRLGHFGSRDAAKAYLEDFKRETRIDAFVASSH